MKTQNVDKSETIFVGDGKNDVLMAKAADVEPVVVLTGHLNRDDAKNLGVKYIIDDVTKLEEILQKLDSNS